MKKWAITILAILVLVALGLTARLWVPWLPGFAVQNKEKVESVKSLVELMVKLATGFVAAFLFVYKLWREKQEQGTKPAQTVTVQNAQARRDVIGATGDVQTGGVDARAQRDFAVDGDLVSGPKTIIYQTAASPTALNPLHQLPSPPADFTGREDERKELRAAILVGGITISGLQGQGGVGKTALALKLAEELTPNFPDAQIYLDLRGVSEKPLTPGEAMAYVVHAFHPEAKLPEKEDELGGTYRSALHGKRVLLLMDNARGATQMRLLIPPSGCALLVTSRQRFTLPGLQAKNLDTLPPSDAKALLLLIAPRIDGEAETIAKLCGYLPQALRLAATALAERVDLAPADYAKRLADEKNRPKLLAGADESVEASINLSYGLLDSKAQKRWRVLAVFPDTFDAPAAAAVWEIEGDATQEELGRLVQCSLLEWNDTARRYRLHDLMRAFASERLEQLERHQIALRHAAYYLAALGKADELYLKGGESLMLGLALFDTERGNIQAGQAWAASHVAESREAARLCNGYPSAGTYCLGLRQHPREGVRWLETALAAARQLKDCAAEGSHLRNLGIAYKMLGEARPAIEYHRQALKIDREIGDRRGEGQDLGNLGNAYFDLGEMRRSIEYNEQALKIDREIRYRRGEGQDLGNLGKAYAALGEARRAIEYQEQALAIFREIDDRRSEGSTLGNLGIAYAALGETRRAIDCYQQQLVITRKISHLRGEGNALWNISIVLNELGERMQAIEHAEASLKIREEIEDPDAEKVRKQLEQWRKN